MVDEEGSATARRRWDHFEVKVGRGKTVTWHTLETLAQLLRRHRADDSVGKAIGKLIRADLVVMMTSACSRSPPTPPKRCSA